MLSNWINGAITLTHRISIISKFTIKWIQFKFSRAVKFSHAQSMNEVQFEIGYDWNSAGFSYISLNLTSTDGWNLQMLLKGGFCYSRFWPSHMRNLNPVRSWPNKRNSANLLENMKSKPSWQILLPHARANINQHYLSVAT